MSETTNWPPFRRPRNGGSTWGGHNRLPSDFERVFDELTKGFAVPTAFAAPPRAWVWTAQTPTAADVKPPGGFVPPFDFFDREDAYHLEVELAGVSPEKVDLTVDEDRVTIRGEKPGPEEPVLRTERVFGAFERVIPLPGRVDVDAVTASFQHGLLTVRLPKRPETPTGKKIEITT